MKQFKIRASAGGQIMTNSRTKGQLSKTAQTYCETWLKEQIYERKKEFSNKYTEKGLIMEDNSLDFVAEFLNLGMLIKNEKYFEDDFMTGTPDVILKDLVIDVKNSWDCFTFPIFDTDIPNNDYFYQAQIYMHLTGINKFKLIYVLSDTPENLIVREVKSYIYRNGIEDIDVEMYEDFKAKMTYSGIPNQYKIKIFDIEKDNQAIELIKERVVECRNYIENLYEKTY